MRVLVTGASGFTGRYMTQALEAAGHHAIDFEADLTQPDAVEHAVATAEAEAVVHLAALAFVHSDDFEAFYRVNQLGTFRLLAAAARHMEGAPVLLASSANIYGNQQGGLLDETAQPDPVNHYAASKFAMELGAKMWADRLRLIVTRPFNYTGVGQEDHFLIPKIVSHFRDRKPAIELGNIDVRRDFGDVRAVVDAYIRLIEQPNDDGPVNICTGEARTIRDIIDIAVHETGHEPEIKLNPAFVRTNEIEVLVGDNSRLRRLAPGWKAMAIEETIAWMLAA